MILHGLYGNQANWLPQARQLAQDFDVYVLDARNHRLSAWAPTMSLPEMAADVAETLAALQLPAAHLLGHSMGGKTAMLLALLQPVLVKSLCVVDIAPVAYPQADGSVIRALQAIELSTLTSRAAADAQLALSINEKAVRDFLLANLQRDAEGRWSWR